MSDVVEQAIREVLASEEFRNMAVESAQEIIAGARPTADSREELADEIGVLFAGHIEYLAFRLACLAPHSETHGRVVL